MDSHIYKKAANRLPAMAGIQIIRFNTRGSASEAGKSEGEYDHGKGEKLDVLAALDYIQQNVINCIMRISVFTHGHAPPQ